MSELDPTWPSDLQERRDRRIRIGAIVVLVALAAPALYGLFVAFT